VINILIINLIIFSQYFGQNKVQYKEFHFKIIETEHFDIYFYQGGDDIATFAEEILEDGYEMLSEDLGIQIDFRIPVILYNSPNDFSQTNVTMDLIEESVGGFSELLKNRMVVPFTGDYEDFRHVLVHELTHVFQFVIYFPSRLEAIFSGDIFYSVPLWVMEGHAEFSSLGWDMESDIFMRDLVMNNNIIPLSALENYGGYIIYKQGQAFYNYVATTYGRKKVGEFVHLIKIKKNLESTCMALFGIPVDEFNDRMLRYYQSMYWPKIELQNNFDEFARIVFDHKKTNSLYNTSIAISPHGDKIVFVSDRTGVAEIVMISSIDGQIIKKLVTSAYSSGYEGLHLYQGGVSWSPDGEYITFAAKSKGEDVLYILDAQNGKVYKRMVFNVDGIYSPHFSTSGREIVFSGLKDSYSDIYIVDINSEVLLKITDDLYTDKYPNFSIDGAIVFVSDRPDTNEVYNYGSYAVFQYDENDGSLTRITPRSGYVASPFFSSEGGIFFTADYDSAYNLYFYSYEETTITKRTDILTGIYYPSISDDGSKIAFSYMNDYGYDVCVVKEPLMKMTDVVTAEEKLSDFTYEEFPLDQARVEKYRPRFTFDYFTMAASYYTALGFSGVGQIAISDILGNHHIIFSSDFYGNITDSDIFINYWYIKRRMDFGTSFFQFLNYYSDFYDLLVLRYLGLAGMVQYPLDRFSRIELGAFAYKVYETRWRNFFPDYYSDISEEIRYNVFYPSLAFIFDNVKWGSTGPHDGRRVRLEGYTTLLTGIEFRSSILDYRRYFRLSPRASFAARLVLAGSWGDDKEYWSIGGPYSLRGYDYYAFSGSKLGFLNLEYRFPFVDRLNIAFPFPLELRNIRGVLFADLGGIYTDSFAVYSTANGFHLEDLKLGIGAGLRFNFLFIIFQFDWARAYDFEGFPDDWKFYFLIGPEW
jgi:Tol biopolymer transport system component